MGVYIVVLLAALTALLCIVICVMEVVKDIKRWIKIFRSAKEDEEQPETERPALYLVNPKGEQNIECGL